MATATSLDTPAALRGAECSAPPAPTRLILNGEPLIGLAAAGRLLPGHRANRHVDGATIWRWITKGSKSTSGGIVRLEAVRVGGRWVTSAGAIRRFVDALTQASLVGAAEPTPVMSAVGRKNRVAAASAELDALLG